MLPITSATAVQNPIDGAAGAVPGTRVVTDMAGIVIAAGPTNKEEEPGESRTEEEEHPGFRVSALTRSEAP